MPIKPLVHGFTERAQQLSIEAHFTSRSRFTTALHMHMVSRQPSGPEAAARATQAAVRPSGLRGKRGPTRPGEGHPAVCQVPPGGIVWVPTPTPLIISETPSNKLLVRLGCYLNHLKFEFEQ